VKRREAATDRGATDRPRRGIKHGDLLDLTSSARLDRDPGFLTQTGRHGERGPGDLDKDPSRFVTPSEVPAPAAPVVTWFGMIHRSAFDFPRHRIGEDTPAKPRQPTLGGACSRQDLDVQGVYMTVDRGRVAARDGRTRLPDAHAALTRAS